MSRFMTQLAALAARLVTLIIVMLNSSRALTTSQFTDRLSAADFASATAEVKYPKCAKADHRHQPDTSEDSVLD